jgi:HD-GYP domain-containing protein (c-di-GMP phosphodiesterase class II)
VAARARAIAGVLGLGAETTETIETAARVQDIGNVIVPDAVLLKDGPLDAAELGRVREHVRVSVDVISALPQTGPIAACVRHHHERWDGTGYPDAVNGDGITLGGRILAAANAYVAVTAGRSYARALSPASALERLAPEAGRQFDPAVYRALQQSVAANPG